MGVVDGIDRFQRRHRVLGFPLAVFYKFFDDLGSYLCALIAYYAFVSLFPLLLLLSTILGIVLVGHPGVQQRLLTSTMQQIPVVGSQLGDPKQLNGGLAGLAIGILGSLYGGLGVAQAIQNAMNTIWGVPRNSRPNPIKARGRSLVLISVIGLTVLATTTLATYTDSLVRGNALVVRLAVLIPSLVINGAAFVFAFRFGTTRAVTVRQALPGAITAAVLWQVLQSTSVIYVRRVVSGATATNGVFAVVLGLIAFLYLTAVVVVLCAEINVVRVLHLWPRALLTPFTDSVQLTGGDRLAYTRQATAQRHKGFETVTVTFDDPDDPPTA